MVARGEREREFENLYVNVIEKRVMRTDRHSKQANTEQKNTALESEVRVGVCGQERANRNGGAKE